MKEKLQKEKHSMKEKQHKFKKRRSTSSSSNSDSDEWVEKGNSTIKESKHDDWMSMTGVLKTYTKNDIKPKNVESKKHIDSYNPGTSSRELNPYWKNGGTGIPQTAQEFRKSRTFVKPSDDEDYFKPSSSKEFRKSYNAEKYQSSRASDKYGDDKYKHRNIDNDNFRLRKSFNWKNTAEKSKNEPGEPEPQTLKQYTTTNQTPLQIDKEKSNLYLSDEKMNKLAAKIVKAEIMRDTELIHKLNVKLEAAREYRKNNPDAGKEEIDDAVMLMSTNSAGNSRPLTKQASGDPRSKGGKRKAETYTSGQRSKYFGNDDKYDLAQMFQEEKYGNNYDDEAQLAKIAGKHKNPNDDLEDIFVDEISKNRDTTKDDERDKQRAINEHKRIERSLDGCEYCIDSKNMVKHLMVSCGNKVYVALPAKKSMIKGHCIITTIQHSTCVTAVDEDIWEEIMDYRKALTQFFNSQQKDVIFFETASRLHRFPHMIINCVPLPRDVGDTAPIYFKKALLECEAEWSMNKKVVELKGKNIRKGVPKGLPYFWVDFGMDPGFAHIIEDQQLFPKTFAEEIIGGILDLDHNLWMNPAREYGDLQRKKVLEFLKEWKPFDTVGIK